MNISKRVMTSGLAIALLLLPLACKTLPRAPLVPSVMDNNARNAGKTLPPMIGDGKVLVHKNKLTEVDDGMPKVPAKDGPVPDTQNEVISVYGLGLAPATVGLLAGASSLKTLPADADGIYSYGCKTVGQQWKSPGIRIKGGRIYGADLYFENADCAGVPESEKLDAMNVAYEDLVTALKSKQISVSRDLDMISFVFPSGAEIVLDRLSLSDVVTPAVEVISFGLGMSRTVAEINKGVPRGEEGPVANNGVFLYGCTKFSSTEWKSSGIQVEGGMLRGLDLFFQNSDCSGTISSVGLDSNGIALVDYSRALKTKGVLVQLDSEKFTLTYSTGVEMLLEKAPIVLPEQK